VKADCLSLESATTFGRLAQIDELLVATVGARSAGDLDANGERFAVLNFPRENNRGATAIYSLVVSSNVDDNAQTERTLIWLGGFGKIYELRPNARGLVRVRALSMPVYAPIELIFWLSSDLGWASTEGWSADPVVMRTSDGGETWQLMSYRWLPAPWVFGAFLIGFFAFERGTRASSKLRPVSPSRHIADYGVSDDPIGLDDADALGLVPISRAMARFLRNVETKPTGDHCCDRIMGIRQDIADESRARGAR